MPGPIETAAVDTLLLPEVSPAGHLNVDEMLRSLMDIDIVKQMTVTEDVPTYAHTLGTSPSSPAILDYSQISKIAN